MSEPKLIHKVERFTRTYEHRGFLITLHEMPTEKTYSIYLEDTRPGFEFEYGCVNSKGLSLKVTLAEAVKVVNGLIKLDETDGTLSLQMIAV